MNQDRVLRIEYDRQYPLLSIAVAVVLIFVAPFVSTILSYAALAVCLYRVFRYDAKVFATDYAILAPMAGIFTTSGGLTLFIILGLIAAIVLFVRGRVKADITFVLLLVILNYLIIRMHTGYSKFLLCFGQLFLLWVLVPEQDAESAERTAKMYCISLLIASVYALLLNNTWQIQARIGAGSLAFFGTDIIRFHGLAGDPNFYMTQLVVGIALIVKLRDSGRIKLLPFVVMCATMTVLGALTYSKTFLLAFAIFVVVYIIWQFRNKNIFLGIFLLVAVILSADFLLFSESSPFSGVVNRLMESADLNGLTTGRTEVFKQYGKAIVKTPGTFFFGYGLDALSLEKDQHNIYLEILYFCGAIGLVLLVSFVCTMIGRLKQQIQGEKQHIIAKYIVLIMVLLLFMTLNGLFTVAIYTDLFLAFMAMLIPAKQSAD